MPEPQDNPESHIHVLPPQCQIARSRSHSQTGKQSENTPNSRCSSRSNNKTHSYNNNNNNDENKQLIFPATLANCLQLSSSLEGLAALALLLWEEPNGTRLHNAYAIKTRVPGGAAVQSRVRNWVIFWRAKGACTGGRSGEFCALFN